MKENIHPDVEIARNALIAEVIIIPATFLLYQKYDNLGYIFFGVILVVLLANVAYAIRLAKVKPKGYLLWIFLLLIPVIAILGTVLLLLSVISRMGC